MSRRRLSLQLCIAASIALASGCGSEPSRPTPEPATRRSIAQGELVGAVSEDGAHVWRGIPFAEPPVADRRWRAPVPPSPWAGTFEALEPGPACAQLEGFADDTGVEAPEDGISGTEDCLTLNVFAPPNVEQPLPVMFWIHGGGNSTGSASIYDGSRLATRQRVIVVTVHYRLGVLGWFHHPALHGPEASDEDRSGNYGTLDLVRALEWVRDEIAAFGGDPSRVTIFGESAGATNVSALLLSPKARGLFHRAISQSGGAWTYSMYEAAAPRDAEPPGHRLSSTEVLVRALIRLGQATDREAAGAALESMSGVEFRDFTRSLSPGELMLGLGDGAIGPMYMAPANLRDGVVLPEAKPELVFQDAQQFNSVPTILGTNRDEDKLFMFFTSPAVRRFLGVPVWLDDADFYDAEARYRTMMWKVIGVDEPAAAMSRAGGAPVFAYRFDWDEEPKLFTADVGRMLGAAHALELPFVFGYQSFGPLTMMIFDHDKRETDAALSDAMMSYWAELAYTGAPGRGRGNGATKWKPWTNDPGEKLLLLDSTLDGGIRMSSDTASRRSAIEGVLEDPRFPGWAERCAVLASFVLWSETMSAEEYESVGNGACLPHPLEAFAS